MKEFARVTTLEELAVALKRRRQSLGLPQFQVDEIAGMARDHTFKIERGIKGLGKVTIPLLLGALKCELVLVPSAAVHPDTYSASTRYAHSPKKDHHAEIGAKGGRAYAANTPERKRRARARAAARARWAKRVRPPVSAPAEEHGGAL